MKKELLILPKDREENAAFNTMNKNFKIYHLCELDSIHDFKENKDRLISTKDNKVFNFLHSVYVQLIEDVVRNSQKRITVFDFSGEEDLSLEVYLRETYYHKLTDKDVLIEKEEFYKLDRIKTLDEVDIVFYYYYFSHLGKFIYKGSIDNKDDYIMPILLYITKSDRGRENPKIITTPVNDLVTV